MASIEDGGGLARAQSVNSANSQSRMRPESRASTTSLQSVGVGNAFQPNPQQHHDSAMSIEQNAYMMQQGAGQSHGIFGQMSGDMMTYPEINQMPQQQQGMEQQVGMPPNQDMRPMSQNGFHDMQQYPMQYPNGMPQYQVAPQHMQHMRQQSEQFEGSPAPEDSNNENGGAKRRKGTASSMANDQELRRLLAQHQGKELQEIAADVQKNEGSGGKSEKAKQVFAMLWLQESCARSTNSVRRDRVFARYTSRCANERVPTLNPASFGKLVRIIFPNVQTRRLGVRGESKYHYVDLSLVPDEDETTYFTNNFDRPETATGRQDETPTEHNGFSFQPQGHNVGNSQPARATMDTADFPVPNTAFRTDAGESTALQAPAQATPKLDCEHVNTPTIRISLRGMSTNLGHALPSIRPNLPATMSTYLAMPVSNSLTNPAPSSQEQIELPDIHKYLEGTPHDSHIAKLLFDLYRSYCIDVIDAFRKCKEKPFFNHHSAFNGKMTVPVAKLFALECLAPWIQECDMRMYKQLVRFVAPLALQNVPDLVWTVFDRIGARLVSHLIGAFEEKCPLHAVVAKVVPAARFANLLKKLKGVNASTLQMSRMLDDPQQRTQMWLDLMVMIDPERVIEESMPPPESLANAHAILRHDIRMLIAPIDDPLVHAAEDDPQSAYANFVLEPTPLPHGILPTSILEQPDTLLEKWTQWLERLPQAFERHHPQCMVDWHMRFWRSIMLQVGSGGAHSYQSWWTADAFMTNALNWMTQMEGFLLSEEDQKAADAKELVKKQQEKEYLANNQQNLKRKRNTEDEHDSMPQPPVTKHVRLDLAPPSLRPSRTLSQPPHLPPPQAEPLADNDAGEETDDDLDELTRGGPLDLPHTGMTSPVKMGDLNHRAQNVHAHDDSGIDLGLDLDAWGKTPGKTPGKAFNKRDWFLSSDPVDPAGVGMGVIA